MAYYPLATYEPRKSTCDYIVTSTSSAIIMHLRHHRARYPDANQYQVLRLLPTRQAIPSLDQTGKVVWDWWNDWNLKGVDFQASTSNLQYYMILLIIMVWNTSSLDEGWYNSKEGSILKTNRRYPVA